MTKSRKKKIGIGLIFVLVLILAVGPIMSMGNDAAPEKVSDKQIGPYVDVYGPNSNPAMGSMNKGNIIEGTQNMQFLKRDEGDKGLYVEYSKSIEGTDTENQFKINLNVTTNNKKEVASKMEPTDLVLIFDLSGSMDTQNSTDGKSRWDYYKPAMIEFINEFLGADNKNQVSIVGFTGNGEEHPKNSRLVHYNLTQGFVNTTDQAIKSFDYEKAQYVRSEVMMKGLKKMGEGEYLGSQTNAQAGFRGGWEAITNFDYTPNDEAKVLFVSDGNPNAYYEGDDLNTCKNVQASESVSVDKAIEEAGVMISKFKAKYTEDSAKLYTLAVGSSTNNATNKKMMKAGANNNPNVDRSFSSYKDINIFDTFDEIALDIIHGVKVTKVTDPMSKYVTFLDFAGDSETAEFDENNKTILWDISKATPVEGSNPTTYSYTLSYYVEFDTSFSGYNSTKTYPTNQETTLDYRFSYDNGKVSEDKTSLFRIPTVIGKKTKETFSFTKEIGKVKGDGQSSSDEFSFLVKVNNNTNFAYKIDTGKLKNTTDGIITIKAGQKVSIPDLDAWTKVTVSEIDMPSFYSPVEQEQSILVRKDNTKLTFVNDYDKSEVYAEKSGSVDYDEPVWHGDTITYTIKVTNSAKSTAAGIAVKDKIPAFTEYNDGSITPSGDSESDNVTGNYDGNGFVHWFIKELKAGESVDLKFTVTVNDDLTWKDQIDNQALYTHSEETSPEAISFDSDGSFDKETNVVTNIPPQPGMEITKSNTPGKDTTVKRGDVIEYTLNVSSTGVPNLNNVWVKDYIPTGTTYVDGSISGNGTYKDGVVEWIIDEITKEAPAKLTFKVKVNDDAVNKQEIENIALAEHLADDEKGNKVDPGTESNPVYNYVEAPEVKGEQANPSSGSNGSGESTASQVLGEEAADDSKVLGDEAKTSDSINMNMIVILVIIAVVALLAILLIIIKRSNGNKN